MDGGNLRVAVSTGAGFRMHCAIVLVLLVAHVAVRLLDVAGHHRVFGLTTLFDAGQEQSVPNLFSSIVLFVCSGLAAMIAASPEARDRRLRAGWILATIMLFFMAIDEGTGLHDRLSREAAHVLQGRGVFRIGWIAPYLLLLAAAAGLLLPFAVALARDTRTRLILAAALYVGSAMGLEMCESLIYERAAAAGIDGVAAERTLPMVATVSLEEFGEMFAVALALRALMLHLVSPARSVSIGIERTRRASRVDRAMPGLADQA